MLQTSQVSKTGLRSICYRDVDANRPRDPLPSRALPDDVRAKLGLAPREGSVPAPLRKSAANASKAPPAKELKPFRF